MKEKEGKEKKSVTMCACGFSNVCDKTSGNVGGGGSGSDGVCEIDGCENLYNTQY